MGSNEADAFAVGEELASGYECKQHWLRPWNINITSGLSAVARSTNSLLFFEHNKIQTSLNNCSTDNMAGGVWVT